MKYLHLLRNTSKKILDVYGGNILPIDLDRIHAREFVKWFESHVQKMKQEGEVISKDIENLSLGPKRFVSCFKGYIVNGFRFHTAEHEKFRKTQNSGVFLSAETSSFDTGNNASPAIKNVEYYEVLDDIVALQYREWRQIFLYKCHWWSVKSPGKKIDEFGFTSLDFTRTIAKDESFILAKQALQVFYVKDNRDKNRRIVLNMQPRDFYDMGIQEVELIQEESSRANDNATTTNKNETATVNTVEVDNWTRNEIEGEELIRSTAANDDDDSADDSNSDPSDYLSDCEQDDLV
ncbi:uncharacterized protein LOC113318645 [Papaver somniferum]|uniref:uncharacterized protein LOC113318645 n=1 Tax=Papaver somniferum TaxID=3469 RepID=UPI000E6F755D|nr:uncharacterized protein LOC113318645 [Papaver somniferum]